MNETTNILLCQAYGEEAARDIVSGLRKAYGSHVFDIDVLPGFPKWRRVHVVVSSQKLQQDLIMNKTIVYCEMMGFCNGWTERSKKG